VLRGEGNVVAHHVPGGPRPPGLEVRFTRVDSKSKLILDRVRDRRTASPPAALGGPPGPAFTAEASIAAPEPSPGPKVPTDIASERSGVHLKATSTRIAAPPNRDEIL